MRAIVCGLLIFCTASCAGIAAAAPPAGIWANDWTLSEPLEVTPDQEKMTECYDQGGKPYYALDVSSNVTILCTADNSGSIFLGGSTQTITDPSGGSTGFLQKIVKSSELSPYLLEIIETEESVSNVPIPETNQDLFLELPIVNATLDYSYSGYGTPGIPSVVPNAYLYIPTDRYLVVVDTVLKKYIGNIYTGFANSTVALNPENKRSVVLGFHTKEAAIFDMSSFGVVDTVKLDGSPVSGTISSNPELSAYVFIAETQSNAVSVISLESSDERKAQSIPLALIPYKIMAHPRTDKIYVLGRDEGITVLARSNKAGELVQIRATVPYPSAPGEELSDAVFNQDGSLLYLLMNQVGSGSPSKILQFDSLNNTISSLIENADSENLLYIFSDASLAYIPKSQGKTVKLLRLAEEVATVADSSRDGKERYLVNAQDNTVLLRSEGQEDSLIEIPYSISSFNTDVLGPIITKGRLVASEELVSFVSHADKEGRVSRKIEFTNTGFLPIKTSTPTLEGRDWSRFTFSSSNCHGRTLINGESCELTVDFLGTDDGQYEAELVLLTGEDDLSLSRVMLTAESRPVEKSSAGMLNVFVLTVLYLVLTGIRRRNLSIPETKLTRTLKPAA